MSWLLSLIWQWFLGKFGMSDAQKLGRAEVRDAELIESAKDYRNELAIKSKPAGSDDQLIDRL